MILTPYLYQTSLSTISSAVHGPYKYHTQISFKTFYDGATIRLHLICLDAFIFGRSHRCSTMIGRCMRFLIPISFALFQHRDEDPKVHANGDEDKEGYQNAPSDFM
ncbi:hypothetical protein BDR05DRAFT_764786 [Suillus weaverae]|nr:hypothetical protein BDR05DRAFT_764786 [Suillus weaverae]